MQQRRSPLICGHLVSFVEVQLGRMLHRDETFWAGILTLTRDERSTFSRALSYGYYQHSFFGLCPPIGTGFPGDTISGHIPATCGAPSISLLSVLILVCAHHVHVYQKMLSRLLHCVMIGDRSPVQNRLVHRGQSRKSHRPSHETRYVFASFTIRGYNIQ